MRSLVVAYDTNYPRAIEIADRYEIGLYSVDRTQVLATASPARAGSGYPLLAMLPRLLTQDVTNLRKIPEL